jgi:hypothetical protein
MWTSALNDHFRRFCSSANLSLHLICPYIRLTALSSILAECRSKDLVVVTTWNPEDIHAGYSDLEIYPWLKEMGAFVYILNRLHAKLLVADYERIVLSSANLTESGLGLTTDPNIEAAVQIDTLAVKQKLWIHTLISQSIIVDDEYYFRLKAFMESAATAIEGINFDDSEFRQRRSFLLSSLPMTASPERLLSIISKLQDGREIDQKELLCALHDVALYEIDMSDDRADLLDQLRARFLNHPFIASLRSFIDSKRFFGEIKEWLQRTCSNVPTPHKKELTEYVSLLLEWLVELESETFQMTVPSYSQCIARRDS